MEIDDMAEMEMEFGADILTLLDEDGTEHRFEVVDSMELEDERYMALVPVFDEDEDVLEDSGELVVLKVAIDGDEEFLEPISDEDEFNKISGMFMERLEDEFDFIESDEE